MKKTLSSKNFVIQAKEADRMYHDQVLYLQSQPITLIKTTINGVPTMAAAIIIPQADGSHDLHPVAILCNNEIFKMMTPPDPNDTIVIEDDGAPDGTKA